MSRTAAILQSEPACPVETPAPTNDRNSVSPLTFLSPFAHFRALSRTLFVSSVSVSFYLTLSVSFCLSLLLVLCGPLCMGNSL